MTEARQEPPRLVPFTGTVAHLDTPTTDRRVVTDHAEPWATGPVPLCRAIGQDPPAPTTDDSDERVIGTITRVTRRTDDTGRLCLDIAGEVEAHALAEDGTLDVAASFTTTTDPVMQDGLLVVKDAVLYRVVSGPNANSIFPGTRIRACAHATPEEETP